ncbi:MAG: hypothetical protein LC667_02985 [Thioalkalivibrio sp.]|nr:hypothetical protein [Thioalkalivibrio sp.]
MQAWRDAWWDRILDVAGVTFVDLDEAANQVVVGIAEPAARGRVLELLRPAGVPAQALGFVAGGKVRMSSEPISAPYLNTWPTQGDSIISFRRPLQGGLMITYRLAGANPNDAIRCTLGFIARLNGVRVAITPDLVFAVDARGRPVLWIRVPGSECQQLRVPLRVRLPALGNLGHRDRQRGRRQPGVHRALHRAPAVGKKSVHRAPKLAGGRSREPALSNHWTGNVVLRRKHRAQGRCNDRVDLWRTHSHMCRHARGSTLEQAEVPDVG